jgi:hypothetical protein
MKKIYSIIIFMSLIGMTYSQTEVNVVTGASYADEIYYDFINGSIQTQARTNWDIAFTTELFDVSVLANNGVGVMLYTYPNSDISGWETVDTTGMVWTPMYNSIAYWQEGAFVSHALGHPDYGWGIYNDMTHVITGDSLFIIKLADGTWKKMAIVEKKAALNEWTFKYANLDNSGLVEVNFDADTYPNRYFVHYSLSGQSFVEQEPTANWNLLFTRFYDYRIPYNVTGVLSAPDVVVQQVDGVDQATFETYTPELFKDTITEIGSDWKFYDMGLGQYVVEPNRVYFVQEMGDNTPVWKIWFTAFAGMSTGTYTFMQKNLTPITIAENEAFSTVYPNPAVNVVNLISELDGTTSILIYDISGKEVYSKQMNFTNGLNKLSIDVQNLPSGIYSIVLNAEGKRSSTKFVKQ